jgi:alkaline phosphatase D
MSIIVDRYLSSSAGRGRPAVVWARVDRPARMLVEWATTDSFRAARRVLGPAALPEDDFTPQVDLPPEP